MNYTIKQWLLLLIIGTLNLSISAKELPVETFFKFAEINRLSMSPDGKYLAARVTKEKTSQLFILDRTTLKMVGHFDFSGDDTQIGQFGWLNDTRVYASMIKKVGPLAEPRGTGFLFAGNFDGSKKRQLLPQPADTRKGSASADRQRGFRFENFLHDDPKNILVSIGKSRYSKIVKLNVYNSRQRKFASSPVPDGGLLLDHNLVPRIATTMDYDTDTLTMMFRSDKDSEWKEISKFNTTKSSFNPLEFTKDNKKVYLEVSNETEHSIYLYDPADGSKTLLKKLKGDADIEGYIYDEDKDNPGLVGYSQEPGYYEKTYFDSSIAYSKKEKMLDDAFAGQYVNIVNTTRDGKLSMLSVVSDKRPVSYYLMDNDTFKVELLMHTRPWINPEEMSERKPISYTARDGLEIRGYLTLPKGKSKNLPFVLVVHGGPYGPKHDWGYDAEAQFLANRGYAVLQVNYRGSGGRGHDFQYGNYRKMGMEMQDDLTDATLWAVEQGYADKERLCIYGGSYGGYASAYAVIKEPDLYKCAIPYAAVFDIKIQAEESDTRSFDNGRRFLDEAWNSTDEEFVRERSAIYHLDKLKAALFLIHGEADARVPFSQYTSMAKALDKIGYPYESMTKAHEPHGFKNQDNRYEMYTRLAAFLNKHIGN